MQNTTVWALLLAPFIGGLIWWLLLMPGRLVSRWLWRVLPEGRLRRVLFAKTGVLDPDKTGIKMPEGP